MDTMVWQSNPFILPLILTAAISAALTILGWQRRPAPGAVPFAVLMGTVTIWSLAYMLQLSSAQIAAKIFWANVCYTVIVIVPGAFLALALEYTGRRSWLSRRNLILLVIFPLLTMLMVWTDGVHNLFRSEIHLDTSGPVPMLAVTNGIGFWLHAVYSYALVVAGVLLLLEAFLRSPPPYRRQTGVLLLGALLPWVGNVFTTFRLSPIPNLDLTPFAFVLTGLAMAWGLFRLRLLDLVPVARNAVVEGMSDGVIVLDAQNRIVDLNPAAQAIIGTQNSQVIGKPAVEIFAARPDLIEQYGYVTKVQAEITLGESDAQRPYDLRISPLYDQLDQLTGRIIVLRDISDRRKVEDALKLERQAFRTMAEAAIHETSIAELCNRILSGLVETLGFDFGTIRLYEAQERVLRPVAVYGLSDAEAQEKIYPLPIDDPQTVSALVANSQEAIFAPDVREHEISQTHKSRLEALNISALISWPFLSSKGELLGIVHMVGHSTRDIGEEDRVFFEAIAGLFAAVFERKCLEYQVEERRFYLESVLAYAPDAIITLDGQQNVLEWNQGACDLFGYAPEEAIGQNIDQLIAISDEKAFEEASRFTEQILSGSTIPPTETVRYRKDGTPVHVILAASPFFVREGLAGGVVVYTDITQRKIVEEALEQARDQALEMSRLKSELLANVSHDFRTPLNAILGYTDMLATEIYGPLSERQRRAVDRILANGHQLLTLINDMIDQAELEAGKLELEDRAFNVVALLEDVRSMLSTQAEAKGLALISKVADGMPEVLIGDEQRIRQIMVNLVNNAIKFTKEGSVKIHLLLPDAEHWAFAVSDTGRGIPQDAHDYVFDPFRQVDGSPTREHGGVGLGLSLVRHLLRLMGGRIELESLVGQGSTFTVILPLTLPQEE